MDILICQNKSYTGELCYTENNEALGQALAKKFKLCISTIKGESIEMFAIQLDKLDIGIPYMAKMQIDIVQDNKILGIETINELYDVITNSKSMRF